MVSMDDIMQVKFGIDRFVKSGISEYELLLSVDGEVFDGEISRDELEVFELSAVNDGNCMDGIISSKFGSANGCIVVGICGAMWVILLVRWLVLMPVLVLVLLVLSVEGNFCWIILSISVNLFIRFV